MKRLLLGVLVAIVIAIVLTACASRPKGHGNVVVQGSPCDGLDPDTNWFLWWFYGCPSAPGGGGSGAA